MATKHVLVTGGNSGIGLALCKLLVTERGCNVLLGSRDLGRGLAAMKTIVDTFPDVWSKIEVLQVDVADTASVAAAAETLKAKGVTLYGLVNNAGVGLAHGDVGGPSAILNVNYYGVFVRVCVFSESGVLSQDSCIYVCMLVCIQARSA